MYTRCLCLPRAAAAMIGRATKPQKLARHQNHGGKANTSIQKGAASVRKLIFCELEVLDLGLEIILSIWNKICPSFSNLLLTVLYFRQKSCLIFGYFVWWKKTRWVEKYRLQQLIKGSNWLTGWEAAGLADAGHALAWAQDQHQLLRQPTNTIQEKQVVLQMQAMTLLGFRLNCSDNLPPQSRRTYPGIPTYYENQFLDAIASLAWHWED